jgi:hypothetical protein
MKLRWCALALGIAIEVLTWILTPGKHPTLVGKLEIIIPVLIGNGFIMLFFVWEDLVAKCDGCGKRRQGYLINGLCAKCWYESVGKGMSVKQMQDAVMGHK